MRLAKLGELGHSIVSQGKRWKRELCRHSCLPKKATAKPETPLSVVLANKEAHPSHHLAWRRGLTFCWTCGAYGVQKMHALSRECRRLADTDRRRKGFGAGLTPKSGVEWPEPEDEAAAARMLKVSLGVASVEPDRL